MLVKDGWTPVSDFFLENYSRLNPPITTTEAMLIIQLMRHKWDENHPYPAFKTLARRMGITDTAARNHARSLEVRKNYLVRIKRVGMPNLFDLSPLFAALEKFKTQVDSEKKKETKLRRQSHEPPSVPLPRPSNQIILRATMPTPTLSKKLNPSRFPGMSPFMAAVVGFVLDESFTNPQIAEITVSESENLVYIRRAGAVGFDGIESLEDLRRNWNRLIDVAGLTPDERREAVELFRAKVATVPGTGLD